jgi:hypothetical protein
MGRIKNLKSGRFNDFKLLIRQSIQNLIIYFIEKFYPRHNEQKIRTKLIYKPVMYRTESYGAEIYALKPTRPDIS